ncbi:hypothetical protein H0H93_008334 [Arthromyces matolae]|nr:hypothetical protein H0H93_008334 [Arthromyces matolae]
MSGDDDDDYLSDKFLIPDASSSAQPKTYAQLRKAAQKQSQLKNDENRTKSRRQRELESRQEGLSKSLFERAKEEEDAGITSGNKALDMMMKMGFKPGQALGKTSDNAEPSTKPSSIPLESDKIEESVSISSTDATSAHIVKPIPLNEWQGKKGIGLGKRAVSPSASAERVAKMAKMAKDAEEIDQRDYRNRAGREYQEKRAEGRLGPARRTCVTLDEKAGKSFHVLWLDPNNPESFPEGLLDALALHGATNIPRFYDNEPIQVRLRKQMQADALQPLDGESLATKSSTVIESFPPEVIEEATQFLRLQAQDRLFLVLSYLRDIYHYCFWCGVQYDDDETMENQCPGPDEESHD